MKQYCGSEYSPLTAGGIGKTENENVIPREKNDEMERFLLKENFESFFQEEGITDDKQKELILSTLYQLANIILTSYQKV